MNPRTDWDVASFRRALMSLYIICRAILPLSLSSFFSVIFL